MGGMLKWIEQNAGKPKANPQSAKEYRKQRRLKIIERNRRKSRERQEDFERQCRNNGTW